MELFTVIMNLLLNNKYSLPMKIKIIENGINLEKLAKDLNVDEGANYLLQHHNTFSKKDDCINTTEESLPIGIVVFVPEEPLYTIEPEPRTAEVKEVIAFIDYKEQREKEPDSTQNKSEHEGKYFVIQKGLCQCDKGFNYPQFKVTSHKKHYWNDENGAADYLAVTEEDLQLTPSSAPFGQCKLRPTSTGYLPCVYAPAGKWQKPYEKTKVMGKSCLTEISELMCTTGGKITIKKHGQVSELGLNNIRNANVIEQQLINPFLDFEEFLEQVDEDNENHYN